MPTLSKPSIAHVSFSWKNHGDEFHDKLMSKRCEILEASGIDREMNDGDHIGVNRSDDGDDFIRELAGILCHAAAIRIDGGFKPVNQIISTLKAIVKNPSLVRKGRVESEALGMIGKYYQRGDEVPGTHWYDVEGLQENPKRANPERVRRAALAAIQQLKNEASKGAPADTVLAFLANRLLQCYLRFNISAGRHTVLIDINGNVTESGPFYRFVELAIAPFSEFFAGHPEFGVQKILSAAQVARVGLHSWKLGKSNG